MPADGAKASTSRTRFTALHAEIRERICLLRYPPGMHMGEEALAAEFGVSRTPIRRVLAALEAEGLVESRHGVATVVTNIDLARLREIYAFRTRLAELIAEFDPRPRTEDDMARLRQLISRGESLRARPDAADYSRLNMAFALEFMKVIGNSALRETSERLYFLTSRFTLESIAQMDLVQEIEIFRQEMAEIVAALGRGDVRAAAFIRRNHIAWSFQRMAEIQPR